MEALEHPCAICGTLTRGGLFPPTIANETYQPGPPAPLCPEHKSAFLRGGMQFPVWCGDCRAWRAAEHIHESVAPKRKGGPPKG